MCIAVTLTACGGTKEFGPWQGYIYVEEAENQYTLLPQGEYPLLNACMTVLQGRVAKNHYPYYCGFNCKKNRKGEVDCDKIIGYPEWK